MTYDQFKANKNTLCSILAGAISDVVNKMSLEEVRKLDWFSASAQNRVPTSNKFKNKKFKVVARTQ